MSESIKKEIPKGLPPGVCFPWETKVSETGPVLGNEAMIKNQWENLDVAAYMYLWWWVHR